MVSELFANLLLALLFGATVGLERESSNPTDPHVGGIRTFSLIALLGAITGVLFLNGYPTVGIVLIAGFFILLVSYYIIESIHTKDFGITSELAAVATFMISLLVVVNIIPLQITVAIFVILIFVLSIKSRTTQFVAGVSRKEIHSFISYAIITLVALPVLPDYSYKLKDIPLLPEILHGLRVDLGQFDSLDLINPRKIWQVVVLITGIDIFGYLLSRLVGQGKGFALTSFMAGFVSSTSATQSLAQKSKNTPFINHLVGAALLANLASFLQVFLLVAPLNMAWLIEITPSIILMVASAGVVAYVFFLKKEPPEEQKDLPKKESPIFSLMPALKFAGLLIIIKIFTKICLMLFGESGFVISSIIASFAGTDAIIVNLADMAGHTISYQFAFVTFLIINGTNLLSKTVYAYIQGDKRFALRFLISAVVILLAGAVWLLFI
jgi:uncharacterized membrane protein (DUF4010 family)